MVNEQKQLRLRILQHRLERTQERLRHLHKVEGRFPWIRLGVLILLLLIIIFSLQVLPLLFVWGVIFFSIGGFAIVTILHQRVIDSITHMENFATLLKSHMARASLRWPEIPACSPVSISSDHPFAADLTITGERSLHQLLDTTISLGGSHRLADWLLCRIPDPIQIAARQRLVKELISRPALRYQLELNGMKAGDPSTGRWDSSSLLQWLDKHLSSENLRPRLYALSVFAGLNILLFALNILNLLPAWWLITIIIYLALQSLNYRQTSELFDESYALARQLGKLHRVFFELENYPFPVDSDLAVLSKSFHREKLRPSTILRRISRIVSAASLRNNPFLSLSLNMLVPWDVFFAYQFERCKRSLRISLPGWLDTWYELEALTALANYSYLNPETTFPEILEINSEPVIQVRAIGHPLLPLDVRVNNDISIHALGEISIITGSNMSGKSTFLRTIGTNLVLAFAGGTTPADKLRIVPFRLFTSMNISDSLDDGISFFYAEVRRLRALLEQLEASQTCPLLYLIDEIFRGTNNIERQIGSHAYTTALAHHNGTGFISTHDLELARLADTIPLVHNYHFREDIQDERMVFDYKLRSGPCPTTNALRIMALAGLPVHSSVKNT